MRYGPQKVKKCSTQEGDKIILLCVSYHSTSQLHVATEQALSLITHHPKLPRFTVQRERDRRATEIEAQRGKVGSLIKASGIAPTRPKCLAFHTVNMHTHTRHLQYMYLESTLCRLCSLVNTGMKRERKGEKEREFFGFTL